MSEQTDNGTGREVATRQEGFGGMLMARKLQFAAALPKHIPVERFMRVVMTAVQNDPELKKADQASLWTACLKAAQDGLLPDGREGAIVVYNTKQRDGTWIKKASWMPMVYGVLKKVRNSGEIATWSAHTVYEKDLFKPSLGDDPRIVHEPYFGAGDPGPSVAFYSIVTFKDGEKSREIMSRAQVEYVRDNFSKKDKDGKCTPAWVKSFDEMGEKTVIKRHSKILPMSTDLDTLLRRDDELYDLQGASDKNDRPTERLSTARRFDLLAGSDDDPEEQETGENRNAPAGDPVASDDPDQSSSRQGAEPETRQSSPASKGSAPDEQSAQKEPEKASGKEKPRAASGKAAQADQGAAGKDSASGSKPAPAAPQGRTTRPPLAELTPELQAGGTEAASRGSEELEKWLNARNDADYNLLAANPKVIAGWRKIAREMDSADEQGA